MSLITAPYSLSYSKVKILHGESSAQCLICNNSQKILVLYPGINSAE